MHTHTHLFNGQFQDKLGKSGQDNQPLVVLLQQEMTDVVVQQHSETLQRDVKRPTSAI